MNLGTYGLLTLEREGNESDWRPRAARLEGLLAVNFMDRASVRCERRFMDHFGERRMGMYRAGQVFRTGLHRHGKHRFINQLRHLRADHMCAEDSV